MIFRRISEQVRAQNWFTVGIELLILVLGVFIGIQASNWNDERSEKVREREILLNIAEDIRADREIIGNARRFATIAVDAGNYALTRAGLSQVESIHFGPVLVRELGLTQMMVAQPPDFPPDMKRRLWTSMTVRYYPVQSSAAFESLMAGGDLALIGNENLVRELQRYRQLWRSLEDSHTTTHKRFRERAVYVGQEFGLSPFTEIDESEFAELLASEPTLAGALRTLVEYTVLHRGQMEAVDNKASELLVLLEQEGVEIQD